MIELTSLSRFAARTPAVSPEPRCEVCSSLLPELHRHVVEIGRSGVQCVCRACAILFDRDDTLAKFRTVPDRVLRDGAFGVTPQRWAELGVPVSLAFCYRDTARGRAVVCYPGPAGTIEAELEPEVWDAVAAATPLAAKLAADVEALVVRGGRGVTQLVCYLVPISTAYELAGRLRASWSGFSGGAEADAALAGYFAELDRRGGMK